LLRDELITTTFSLGAVAELRPDEPSTTTFLWVQLQSYDQTI
jgi:hypothetical protein